MIRRCLSDNIGIDIDGLLDNALLNLIVTGNLIADKNFFPVIDETSILFHVQKIDRYTLSLRNLEGTLGKNLKNAIIQYIA